MNTRDNHYADKAPNLDRDHTKVCIDCIADLCDLSPELVANPKAFRDFVIKSVVNGKLLPSTAVELYCERFDLSFYNIVSFMDDYFDFHPYDAAIEALDELCKPDDVPEVFAYLDEYDDRSAADTCRDSGAEAGTNEGVEK